MAKKASKLGAVASATAQAEEFSRDILPMADTGSQACWPYHLRRQGPQHRSGQSRDDLDSSAEGAWVQIDLGNGSHDHLITAEDRFRIAMARQ